MDINSKAIIPSFTFVSDLDPNAQKNRIPTDAELVGLRAVAGVHSRLLSHLKDEAKRAEMTHESLLAKYQQQLRELEGTQSQLHESKKVLQLMEEQCNTLQAETERLAGMIHPIRRFPADLLQYIFESVFDLQDTYGLRTALDLSHVCQRWRTIANDSPRLWSTVDYTMDKKDSNISASWSWIIPQMKAVPPSLIIWDVDANKIARLKHLGLHSIPIIKILELHLANPDNFGCLGALGGLLPATEIKFLEISWNEEKDDTEEDAIWDLGVIFKKDFISPKLILCAACTMRLTPSIHLGSITTLTLWKLKEVNVSLILTLFGQLNTLQLQHTICSPVGEPVTSSSLTCLVIRIDPQENGMVWLTRLSCPNLTSLHGDALDSPDEWVSFVQRHPSLLTLALDCCRNDRIMPRIASVAPQIRHLDICVENADEFINWQTAGLPGPPFPSLNTLTISNTTEFRENQFVAIVQARCLPRHHPDCKVSLDLVPLASLTITNPDEDDTDIMGPWCSSEYFKQAHKRAMVHSIWGTLGTKLSWA